MYSVRLWPDSAQRRRGGFPAVLFGLALAGGVWSAPPFQTPTPECGWPETEPAQFANRRGFVEWSSDADRRRSDADSGYAFSRFVGNRGSVPLLIQWDVGGMLLPALPPGHVATLCERLPMQPYMVYGPIAIEGGGRPVHTTVWQAGYDERDVRTLSGRELEAVLTIGPAAPNAGRVIAIRVITRLLPGKTLGEFRASYAIENSGTTTVEVTWPVAPPLPRELGFARPLTPPDSGANSTRWETESGLPVFVHVPLTLSSPGSRSVIATVMIPTFAIRESLEQAP